MTAKCNTPEERIMAAKAIHEAGLCPVFDLTLKGIDTETYPNIHYDGYEVTARRHREQDEFMPLQEFILRGQGRWQVTPPSKVAGHDVVFSKGSVKIGELTVTNGEVREVYKHLID